MLSQPASVLNDTVKKDQLPLIYILGNSHSGSTLLGFLLSAHPDIIFLGELKARTWLKERHCSCGAMARSCPFYEGIFGSINTSKQKLFEEIRTSSPFKLLFRPTEAHFGATNDQMDTFYAELNRRVLQTYPQAKYITDSSKSLWMLDAWLHSHQHQDIKIIWLRRPLEANVASFVKRGNRFFKSMLSVITNDRMIGMYLRKNKLNYLEINYADFYENYSSVLRSISGYLRLEIPEHYVNHGNHHVISGNRITRHSFTNQFGGLYKDDQWKSILTKGQKRILSWFK